MSWYGRVPCPLEEKCSCCGLFSWVLERVAGSVVFPCTQIVSSLGTSDLLCLRRITMCMQKVTKRKSAELQRRFGMEGGWSHAAFIDKVNSAFFSVTSVDGRQDTRPPRLHEAPGSQSWVVLQDTMRFLLNIFLLFGITSFCCLTVSFSLNAFVAFSLHEQNPFWKKAVKSIHVLSDIFNHSAVNAYGLTPSVRV